MRRGRAGGIRWSGTAALVAGLVLALATACGGGGGDSTGPCLSDRDCTGGGHCIDGRCVGGDAGTDEQPPDGTDVDGDGVPDLTPGDDGAGDADADEDVADADGSDGDADGDGDVADADGSDGDGDGDADADDGGTTCVDLDGDGHGAGCPAGPDCNDTDPLHFNDCADCDATHAPGCPCETGSSFECYSGPAGTDGIGRCAGGLRLCIAGFLGDACEGEVLPAAFETCGDGVDNDCNGVGDEEVYGPCGNCDITCRSDGELEPDPSDPGATGLMTNPDGPGVVLGAEDIHAGYLWAANDPDGTVSKLDLETGLEVARYYVGLWGTGCDSPSRTAVDGLGNAYVAMRAHVGCAGMNQGSVTKMAGDPMYCVDRNGNTVIDTSTGSTPLPLNTDECVLWTVPLAGAGGIPRGLAIDLGNRESAPGGYPWVAAWTEMKVYQISPDDGSVIASVDLNVNPYGLAVDSLGNIWVSGRAPNPGYIQKFSTLPPYTVDAPIEYSSASGCGGQPYGITVDSMNRPWTAAYVGADACAGRYDPATGTWMGVHTGRAGWGGRGMAAGADGTIWMSIHPGSGGAMASWNMADGSGLLIRDIAGVTPVGIGLDELGHVWTVNQATSNVTRLTLATGALEEFPVGRNPYTYSDFTGYQRRLMIPRGTWTRDYERCAVDSFDRWGGLTWDADVPTDARLTITAQSADVAADLDAAAAVPLAIVPSDAPPVDLTAAFATAGVPLGRFLRITVLLEASPDRESPVFRSIDVQWHCYRM